MKTLAGKPQNHHGLWPPQIVLLGVCFGLVTGLFESASWGTQLVFESLPLFKISSTWTVAPAIANAILFGMTGVLLAGLSVAFKRVIPLQAAVVAFAIPFCMTVAFHFSQGFSIGLHVWSLIVLSMGASVQVSRLLLNSPGRFPSRMLRTTAVAAAIVLSLWTVDSVSRRSVTVTQTATQSDLADSPDVLLLVLDTVRAESLSMYGFEQETTPNLARLAERGVVFEHAIATAPWTLPSHASMFTGQAPHEHGADWCSPLAEDSLTIAEAMSQRGFQTAGVVGNLYYCGSHTGLGQGFDFFSDVSPVSADVFRNSILANRIVRSQAFQKVTGFYDWPGRRYATEIHSTWFDWLDHSGRGRPKFSYLNYFDVHAPYLPPQKYAAEFAPRNDEQRLLMAQWNGCTSQCETPDATSLAIGRMAYHGCLAALDEQIGVLLDELERRGTLDDTVIIVTSDHGEHFGEHGVVNHGRSVYRQVIHVPLLVSAPRLIPEGIRVRQVVSLQDLPATIMDLTGGEAATFPGKSLSRFWKSGAGNPNYSEPVFAEVSKGILVPDWLPNAHAAVRTVFVDGFQYIRRDDNGQEELFDFFNDHLDSRNLVDQSTLPPARLNACRSVFRNAYSGVVGEETLPLVDSGLRPDASPPTETALNRRQSTKR